MVAGCFHKYKNKLFSGKPILQFDVILLLFICVILCCLVALFVFFFQYSNKYNYYFPKFNYHKLIKPHYLETKYSLNLQIVSYKTINLEFYYIAV